MEDGSPSWAAASPGAPPRWPYIVAAPTKSWSWNAHRAGWRSGASDWQYTTTATTSWSRPDIWTPGCPGSSWSAAAGTCATRAVRPSGDGSARCPSRSARTTGGRSGTSFGHGSRTRPSSVPAPPSGRYNTARTQSSYIPRTAKDAGAASPSTSPSARTATVPSSALRSAARSAPSPAPRCAPSSPATSPGVAPSPHPG